MFWLKNETSRYTVLCFRDFFYINIWALMKTPKHTATNGATSVPESIASFIAARTK